MKLFHADLSVTGCSFDGKQYKRDKDGTFDVPAEAAAELIPHGFSTSRPVAPPEPDAKTVPIGEYEKLAEQLVEARQEIAELEGKAEAAEAERDDALKLVADLQAELEAAKAKKK